MASESVPAVPDVPTSKPLHESSHSHLVYTTVPGFFAQDDPATNDKTFDFTKSNFGLIAQTYDTDADFPAATTQWQRFENKLMTMNADSQKTISYRLLFLGRHGQGYHNVAERFFGTTAWNCYYSTLNGTKNMTWVDAHLTALGIGQAKDVNAFWRKQITEEGMPTPESYYSSPLDRSIHTAQITFQHLDLPADRPFKPIVKELLREGIGIHTCDRRSSRSYIHNAYPDVEIEDGFAEEDTLWLPDLREPGPAQVIRLQKLLDDVVTHDSSTWISMTSHSGTIQSTLRAVGHRPFNLVTGGVIPVLVKVEVVQGERQKDKAIPWETKPDCKDGEPGEKEVEDGLKRLEESVRGTKL